jgi:hypothetical protein
MKKGPRLVFHFDINGTITAVDTTEPGSIIENANMVISKSVYGKPDGAGVWHLNQDIHDEKDSISYYDYLKSQGVVDYKRQSFLFTLSGQPGERLAHLVDHIAASTKSFLFPSFIRAITAFPDALIVVRTFGQDVDDVLKNLLETPSVAHQFSRVVCATPVSNDTITVGGKLCTYHDFNKLLQTIDSHILIQENYDYWNSNGRKKEFGKQLLGSQNLFQIFFDDNDCVHVRSGDTINQTHFVRVNTMEALQNPNYFIEHVQRCIVCVSCHKFDYTTMKCPFGCPHSFCVACAESELHTGSFMCNTCNTLRCNTYKEATDNGGINNNNAICWMCKTRAQCSGLITDLANCDPRVKELIGDSSTAFTNKVLDLCKRLE